MKAQREKKGGRTKLMRYRKKRGVMAIRREKEKEQRVVFKKRKVNGKRTRTRKKGRENEEEK